MTKILDRRYTLPENVIISTVLGIMSFLISLIYFSSEAFFWAFIVFVSTLVFQIVGPNVSFRHKIKSISIMDLFIPCVIIVFATADGMGNLKVNAIRLVYFVIFFVGFGTAARIIFIRNKDT